MRTLNLDANTVCIERTAYASSPVLPILALEEAECRNRRQKLDLRFGFPKLRKAARTMASAMEVLMGVPETTEERLVPLVEV
ncbi:hypothetical protein [Rhizohabitans arisaemae]|uniref:hypothetical protein n=1 Tax=Rhizohabitans arisaemae TaxID=2720610 RepID=UPI0024B07BF6|nr:hypothetical protein [Rhizohabitans arisaemae]